MRKRVIAAIGVALIAAAPTASAVPTYDDGDAFIEDVRDRGILENYSKGMLYQTLSLICEQASNASIPQGLLTSSYMDGYGLSKKDAQWLINAALDKCN
jgi:hypothetical protein